MLPHQQHHAQGREHLHLPAEGSAVLVAPCDVLRSAETRTVVAASGSDASSNGIRPREDIIEAAGVHSEEAIESLAMKGPYEEQGGLPTTGLWAHRVVISVDHMVFLLPLVCLEQVLGMVRENEVISIRGYEERWRERATHVIQGLKVFDVEACLRLDDGPHKCEHRTHSPRRRLGVVARQLLCKDAEGGEGTVEHEAGNGGVTIRMQECSESAHRSAPESDRGDPSRRAQIVDAHRQVVPLEPTQRYVLALRDAAAREVEAE
mmetsp:Transcript_107864/g.230324  ORF Transcript_107864/g.230324 Transcript_107864/m.230324 type:complete len:263 (+) Transcript_107864:562-1350(+)